MWVLTTKRLGLGALLPQKHADGSWNRAELDSNDQLRRQLLGKNYQKIMREKAREKKGERLQKGGGGQPSDSGVDKPVGEAQKEDGDDDDDEEGRTAAIGKKTTQSRGQGQRQGQSKNQRKKKNKKRKADSNDNSDLDLDPQSQSQSQSHTEAETVGDESEPVRDGDGQTQDKDGEEGKDEVGKENPGNETLRGSKGRKKATSFLDEILAERSKRRKKR